MIMRSKLRAVSLLITLGIMLTMLFLTVPATPVIAATHIYVNSATGDDTWTGISPDVGGTDGPRKTIQAGIDVNNR